MASTAGHAYGTVLTPRAITGTRRSRLPRTACGTRHLLRDDFTHILRDGTNATPRSRTASGTGGSTFRPRAASGTRPLVFNLHTITRYACTYSRQFLITLSGILPCLLFG